jgi:hypothetical protein
MTSSTEGKSASLLFAFEKVIDVEDELKKTYLEKIEAADKLDTIKVVKNSHHDLKRRKIKLGTDGGWIKDLNNWTVNIYDSGTSIGDHKISFSDKSFDVALIKKWENLDLTEMTNRYPRISWQVYDVIHCTIYMIERDPYPIDRICVIYQNASYYLAKPIE